LSPSNIANNDNNRSLDSTCADGSCIVNKTGDIKAIEKVFQISLKNLIASALKRIENAKNIF